MPQSSTEFGLVRFVGLVGFVALVSSVGLAKVNMFGWLVPLVFAFIKGARQHEQTR